MPKPLPQRKRTAILADIQAGTKSRNQIARDHDVSPSTVTGIAKAAGIDDAFDRSQTLKAARAKQADNKALRAELQRDLLLDAQRVRARIWGPCKVVVGGPEGAEIVTLDEAPLADLKSGFTAIGIIVDKDRAYERDKADGDGADHAKSMLGQLARGLAAALGEEPETPQDDS